ncbi:protein hairy-like [Physella acuta]|uniref:protein hairy-like n=1 Tax=Physella acuta TaxID=109671 RepID=UPI0027DB76E3|nr:protein hairy-like [Physella acuta]
MMTEADLSSPTSSTGDYSPKNMDDKTNYRKSNKPMMEKKRRARINSCLSQLKSLVLQAMKKDNSQYSKLEKADILELTVKHLKNVQRFQTNVPDAISKYRAGFNECASEVIKYLGESQGVNEEARTRILTHLASILTPINNLPLQQNHTPILPAPSPTQQHHLQHLQLHQQHQQQSVYLTPSAQILTIDTNNNQPHHAYVTQTNTNIDVKPVISESPTAFQTPISSGMSPQSNLQIPCIATSAQLHLVPSTLPSGQVALVLAPQTVPSMNFYTAQQITRHQEPVSSQEQLSRAVEDYKSRLASNNSPIALVTKPSRQQRPEASAPYKRPATPPQRRQSPVHSSASSVLPPHTIKSETISSPPPAPSTLPKPATSSVIINTNYSSSGINVITNTNNYNNNGNTVIRTTSTWRPW